MKRFFIALAFIGMLVGSMASCASSHGGTCDAYGSNKRVGVR